MLLGKPQTQINTRLPDLSEVCYSHQNYLDVYYGENAARLRCVKRKYDPKNLFQFEQGVVPAATECLHL